MIYTSLKINLNSLNDISISQTFIQDKEVDQFKVKTNAKLFEKLQDIQICYAYDFSFIIMINNESQL